MTTARDHPWRRQLTRAALCLLLGAVTTVGVAWAPLDRSFHPFRGERREYAMQGAEGLVYVWEHREWISTKREYTPMIRGGPDATRGVCVHYLRGWPARAMSGWIGMNGASDRHVASYHLGGLRFLPLTPHWPGFLLDTLFYAASWWPLLATPGLVKRWRRKRRGACLACGYDLRGLGEGATCPECGEATRVAARRRPALSDDC